MDWAPPRFYWACESKNLGTTSQAQTPDHQAGRWPEPGGQVGMSHQMSWLFISYARLPVAHQAHVIPYIACLVPGDN